MSELIEFIPLKNQVGDASWKTFVIAVLFASQFEWLFSFVYLPELIKAVL